MEFVPHNSTLFDRFIKTYLMNEATLGMLYVCFHMTGIRNKNYF